MPIIGGPGGDLKLRLSIKTGTAGNQSLQPDAGQSLGKYVSLTDVVDASLNNVFDDVSGDDNAASVVDYRCVFICNTHATLTLLATKAWFLSEVAGGANAAIAVDNLVASDLTSSSSQAASIVNELTAPVAVGAFSSPTSKGTGIVIGNIGPGQCRAIWLRRSATNSGAKNMDGVTLQVEGDSQA